MIKKIPIEDLKAGMYVSALQKGGDVDMLSFMNSILIKDETEIKKLKSKGYLSACIVEDDPRTLPLKTPQKDRPASSGTEAERLPLETTGATSAGPPPVVESFAPYAAPVAKAVPSLAGDAVDFNEELRDAREVRDEAEELVRCFMESVRAGEEIETDRVNETVGKMVSSIFRNQDALTSLSRLKSFDDYTFAHSVNVCILSLTLGRHMGFSEEALHNLGVGAILHDIGKMLVPETILKKPGSLSDAEFREMKRHTELGGDMLRKTKDITDESRRVALHHHEKFDGSGYQDRLSGEDIHLFARIATVADVYDAMTSNRVYQKGMLPEAALKKMYLMRGTHFDPELVERLVRSLGIYPIGSFVELSTGELAVVRMPNHEHPLQPRVLIFSRKDKTPCEKRIEVDLKGEIGRWIIAARDPGPLKPVIDRIMAEAEGLSFAS
ncbi:MAG: HD-GYP domain-containing protein [Deltaproteobacteria bacterium]|nr:HD-GYP domain-containing protein [Deltaproteobacteria bacterium]